MYVVCKNETTICIRYVGYRLGLFVNRVFAFIEIKFNSIETFPNYNAMRNVRAY